MKYLFIIFIALCILSACNDHDHSHGHSQEDLSEVGNELGFQGVISNHLNALESKNMDLLMKTVPDSGSFNLIVPAGFMFNKVSDFIKGYESLFGDEGVTINSKVLESKINGNMGTAIVLSDLNDDDRNGKPYFHKMLMTYTAEKKGNDWKIISSHGTTVEKSE